MTVQSLLPARAVWSRYGVCSRTIDRWLGDPELKFPKPVVILKRRYWEAAKLEEWERQRAGRGAA